MMVQKSGGQPVGVGSLPQYLQGFNVLALFVEVVVWLFGIGYAPKFGAFCLSDLFKGQNK